MRAAEADWPDVEVAGAVAGDEPASVAARARLGLLTEHTDTSHHVPGMSDSPRH